MARIRTVKPTFFRHEGLQDLEGKNPGQYVMLVFAGLWGHCDKAGRFEWRPRQLKLDILPFLEFDIIKTLELLRAGMMVIHYRVEGKDYGVIPSFREHQRIGGKEAQEPEKYPSPPEDLLGSIGEAPVKHLPAQEGNGIKEEEGNGLADADASAAKSIFGEHLTWLAKRYGKTTDSLRGWIGKCCRDYGQPATLAAILELRATSPPPVDPVPYMRRILESNASFKNGHRKLSPTESTYAGFALALTELDKAEQPRDSRADRDAAGALLDTERQPRIAKASGG